MNRLFEALRVICPVSAAVLLFAVQPAHAWQPSSQMRLVGTERVSYGDLDLSRETDAEILLERIKKAAYRACGGDPRRHPAYTLLSRRVEMAYRECREDAVARAVDSVDAPVLSLARLQLSE